MINKYTQKNYILLISFSFIIFVSDAHIIPGRPSIVDCDIKYDDLYHFDDYSLNLQRECGFNPNEQLFDLISHYSLRPDKDGPLILSPPCRPKKQWLYWFSADESITLLNEIGTIMLFGDSLTRHLTQGLITVLNGDYRRGAMNHELIPQHLVDHCQCDNQYSDGHAKIESCYPFSLSAHALSDNYPLHPLIHRCVIFYEDYNSPDLNRFKNALQREIEDPKPHLILFLSAALHVGLQESLFPYIYQPYIDIVKNEYPSLFQKLVVILGNPTPAGEEKPEKYIAMQGNPIIEKFTLMMKKYKQKLENEGVDVYLFNRYNIGKNSRTIDGTHYMSRVNSVMAQLFFHCVAEVTGLGDFCLKMFEKNTVLNK